MKIELEDKDILAIATKVVDMLKPVLKSKVGAKEEDSIFDVEALSKYLLVDSQWIYKRVYHKTIPFIKMGKLLRFKKSAIDQWINDQEMATFSKFKVVK